MINIHGIPALQDNYIWALHSLENNALIVVDPGSAKEVLIYLQKNKLTLEAILLTHHHWDHCAGVPALAAHYPDIAIYGPTTEKIAHLTHPLCEGDKLSWPAFALDLSVIEIPGHTLGHVGYYNNQLLFSGDTLFSVGCGRLFEGSAEQLYRSLQKINQLPANTQIYCGHEYTLANIAFAQSIDPTNSALLQRLTEVQQLRAQALPSLPSSLATERLTNPFLRCADPSLIENLRRIIKSKREGDIDFTNPSAVFAYLRGLKDRFTVK